MSELFPLAPEPANTNEDLTALRNKHPSLSNTYLNVHMRPDWSYAKGFFDGIWSSYRQFADHNFPSELQKDFSERSWELYLFHLIQENALKVISQARNAPNPDLKVDLGDRYLFIEAVNAGQGEDHNRVETISDLLTGSVPGQIVTRTRSFDEVNHPKIRRITSALSEKMRNYTESHKTVVRDEDFYVIALSAGDIEGSMASAPEALILEAVKGINSAIHIPFGKDGSRGPEFHTTRSKISNSKGTNSINLNMFDLDGFKEISGIIYFGRDVINALLQDLKPDETMFVHNPNAKAAKRMPLSILPNFTQITISPIDWTRHPPKRAKT